MAPLRIRINLLPAISAINIVCALYIALVTAFLRINIDDIEIANSDWGRYCLREILEHCRFALFTFWPILPVNFLICMAGTRDLRNAARLAVTYSAVALVIIFAGAITGGVVLYFSRATY